MWRYDDVQELYRCHVNSVKEIRGEKAASLGYLRFDRIDVQCPTYRVLPQPLR